MRWRPLCTVLFYGERSTGCVEPRRGDNRWPSRRATLANDLKPDVPDPVARVLHRSLAIGASQPLCVRV